MAALSPDDERGSHSPGNAKGRPPAEQAKASKSLHTHATDDDEAQIQVTFTH